MSDADERVWQGSFVEIEAGDLFVIVRGEMVHPGGMTVFGLKVPPKFTDQYDGVVFEAMEVCGTMVAAKAHFPFGLAERTASINLADFETMTVTKRYLEQLLTGKQEEEEPDKPQNEGVGIGLADIMRLAQQQQQGGGPPQIHGIQMPFPGMPPNLPFQPPDEEDDDEELPPGVPPWETDD